MSQSSLALLAKTIRVLSAEGVEKANSGHPGMPMGSADYASVMWSKFINFNPQDTNWPNRDRFVLSAGHGSMLLYSLLHLFGFDLPMSELKNFRQWDSKTPGHPEFGWTNGVETTTGPLGQGISNAVGLALSQQMLAARYGEDLFNYKVYGICSDGDLMEGISGEAASLAGHLQLGNLIFIYDDNNISIGGSTNVCFTEDVAKRFEAYGWHVQKIDGHDQAAAEKALQNAVAEKSKPSIICARTRIGFGSPDKVNTAEVHGAPLGKEEMAKTKKALGWEYAEEFFVPAEVSKFTAECVETKKVAYADWQKRFKAWQSANPEKAKELAAQEERAIPADLRAALIAEFKDVKKGATRNLSGKAIQVIAKALPCFVGGSADLEPSTKTLISGTTDIQAGSFSGKNLRFGVREHAMGAIANGLAYTRSWIPYTATFLVFSDYMRPTVRLAALSHLQTLFVFTHDSFWVGEDGPTHQPIEQLMCLRAIPNLYVFRPADGLEVALSYWQALNLKKSPSALLFTRQDLPTLEHEAGFDPAEIEQGGYVLSGRGNSELTIVASGSEVALAVDAGKLLQAKGVAVRVVSMPCMELFNQLPAAKRAEIIPPQSKKVSIEAGSTWGWEKIVGSDGLLIGKDDYGASAPGEVLADKFGLVPDKVAAKISAWLKI